ncbi:MAG: hypothetical protein JXR96_21735 [Deltaproteobacteria bacterium]|nr:hypothetical protein [Deltaproteobacteria bacterium]
MAVWILALAALVPRPAAGQVIHKEMPEHDFGLGPAVAYVRGEGHGFAVDIEGSYTYGFFTAALDFKLARDGDCDLYGPQLELSAWYFVNAGVGAGYLFGGQDGPLVHVFLGVPWGGDFLPDAMEPFSSLYLEPYYRLHFFFPGDGFRLLHEAGLMIKISTYSL